MQVLHKIILRYRYTGLERMELFTYPPIWFSGVFLNWGLCHPWFVTYFLICLSNRRDCQVCRFEVIFIHVAGPLGDSGRGWSGHNGPLTNVCGCSAASQRWAHGGQLSPFEAENEFNYWARIGLRSNKPQTQRSPVKEQNPIIVLSVLTKQTAQQRIQIA